MTDSISDERHFSQDEKRSDQCAGGTNKHPDHHDDHFWREIIHLEYPWEKQLGFHVDQFWDVEALSRASQQFQV